MLIAAMCLNGLDAFCQCNPNVVYGLTNVGRIRRINVSTGAVGPNINPAFGGNAPSFSNAMGYNPLNGRSYFFKRNSNAAPQEFVSYDPATNLYSMHASSPVAAPNIINLGCVNNTGLGYYCMDALGILYYYNVATNTWTTICSNIRNQFGTTLSSIIGVGSLNRIYGDIAIDGLGNMWILISGATDYGLYRINGPLPTTNVANLTAIQQIPPNTLSPGGSFGGVAFSMTGDMYIASNSPNNQLYRLNSTLTLSFVANLGFDGIGNDLTSCNFPIGVLASSWVKLSTSLLNENTATLNWNILEPTNGTGYAVEHSTDGISWTQIHYTLKIGNDLNKKYSYSQSNLISGIHYYRIRKTEPNGLISYSAVSRVTIKSDIAISIWPNPAQDVLRVQDVSTSNSNSHLYIHDNTGRMIGQSVLKKGVNSIEVHSLPAGTYILRIKRSNGEITNSKFVKQ